MLSFLKNWTLPVAIAVGTALYLLFAYVPALEAPSQVLGPLCETLLPITLFLTLFVTFSKVDFHLMRLRRWHLLVLTAQLLLIALFVGIILWQDHHADASLSAFELQDVQLRRYLLEAILVCILAPCASASPVVTAKLGGDLTQMTTFVLLSSVVTSVLIPIIFPILEPSNETAFLTTFLAILQRLALVLLLPLVLGAVVRHHVKPLYRWFVRTPDLGFYLWCLALSITTGITVRNILNSHAGSHLFLDIALFSLLTALVQFLLGRLIGKATGHVVCSGQGMFQKNTGLAIWITYTYLTPVASIGAGCYVLWQNLINSFELWQHRQVNMKKQSRIDENVNAPIREC